MGAPNQTEFLETLAKVLLRCAILGFLLLLFWFGAVMIAGDVVYGIHGLMFGMSRNELQVIHYCGMGLTKLVVGCFFLIPWVAVQLVLRQETAK
jgi:hypothetical protein